MSVKMSLSFETDQELQEALNLLKPRLLKVKIPSKQNGKYRKAYLFLKETVVKSQEI